MGRNGEALKCYEEAINIDPGHARTHYKMGQVLYAMSKYEAALECCKEALRIDPDQDALRHKAACLAKMQRHLEALECCKEALRIDPQDAVSHHRKATVCTLWTCTSRPWHAMTRRCA